MAERAQPLGLWVWAGGAAAGLLLTLSLAPIAAVLARAGEAGGLGPADWAAVRFTLVQASLSATLSVLFAVPLARALARRSFRGRRLLVTVLGAPFILPVIVAVLGLVAVYGRSGWISGLLAHLGQGPVDIYGLAGVALAHVFFNLPLATRLILQEWAHVPGEHLRLAAALGFRSTDTFWIIEWPILRSTVPGAFVLVFLISAASFTVALTLGGGPKATTIELAIYQAFLFEFDLGRAATLAAIQFTITAALACLAFWLARGMVAGGGLDRPGQRWDANSATLRFQDGTVIFAAGLFLLTPLLAIALRGIDGIFDMPVTLLAALGRSVWVAMLSVCLTLALAFPLAVATAHIRNRRFHRTLIEFATLSALAVSPLVMGSGLFLILFQTASPHALALPITALVNAALSLPFAYRIIAGAIETTDQRFGRLTESLGLVGWSRVRLVLLPRVRRPAGFALGLTAALSLGDLGVIALFAAPGAGTLPLEIYRLMAVYRMDAAAGGALLLLVSSLGAFWLFDRGGRLGTSV